MTRHGPDGPTERPVFAPEKAAGFFSGLRLRRLRLAVIVRLIDYARDHGYNVFDLGIAPLSSVGRSRYASAPEKAARLAFEHGSRFYSYKGLRGFKAKFDPQWQGVYLAYRPRSPLPTLLDIAALIAGGYRRPLTSH